MNVKVCYGVSEETAASTFRATKLGWLQNYLRGGNVIFIQEGWAGFLGKGVRRCTKPTLIDRNEVNDIRTSLAIF
jgi:hypothetical protein